MAETRGGSALTRRQLVLYCRSYCHLCEEMRAELETLQGELAFDLEVIDIDADRDLAQRYNDAVPLLMIGGRELARWRLDAAAMRANFADIG